MDCYHSIVGPMVSYHWKPLKNHCVQWLPDYKTIEKTIGTNGFWTKNHWKNHWYQWFWRPKTIVKPLISMVVFQPFMVSMKTCKCCNGGNQKANIKLKLLPRVTFVTLGQVSLSKVCLFLCFCWTNHVFLRFGLFLWTSVHFPQNHW